LKSPTVSFHIHERIAPEPNSMIKIYLKQLTETSTRRDAREDSYSPVLKELLEEYSNSTRDGGIRIRRVFCYN